jgi:hypothetical protein
MNENHLFNMNMFIPLNIMLLNMDTAEIVLGLHHNVIN